MTRDDNIQLALHFSDYYGIDRQTLKDYGAFDVSIISDLPLFIDPFLLFNSTEKPEYQALHESIIRYLLFLRDKSVGGAVDEGLLRSWYFFKEVKQNWLGFTVLGNGGRALGKDFAETLHRNLGKLFDTSQDQAVSQGRHLEKISLIRGGVGRDSISDFTTNLIKEFLLEYTQAFAREHLEESDRQEFRPFEKFALTTRRSLGRTALTSSRSWAMTLFC